MKNKDINIVEILEDFLGGHLGITVDTNPSKNFIDRECLVVKLWFCGKVISESSVLIKR